LTGLPVQPSDTTHPTAGGCAAVAGEAVEFRLPWGVIRGEAWGPMGAPLVLAIHGWLDNAASWRRIGPALSGFRVVAIDLAGHGLSDHRPPGVRYHHVDNVDDVVAVADALQYERYILLGHSMGAGIAPMVAAIDTRLTHMVLVEGIGSQTSAAVKATDTLREAVTDLRKALNARMPVYPDRTAAIEARTRAIGRISTSAATLLCDRGLGACEGGFTWTSDPRLRASSALRFTEESVLAFLRDVRVPVLVVLGNDSAFKVEEFYHARLGSLSDVRLERIAGNHHLHLEAESAEPAVNLIRDFLASRSS
jgi:pimeloyl-ACP methyl ester carboxylesterase